MGSQITVGCISAVQASLLYTTGTPLIDARSITVEMAWKPQGRPTLAVNSINVIVMLTVQD
jgi:hypothetical protein